MSDRNANRDTDGCSRKFELENFLPYRLSVLTNTISEGIARSYRDRHEISVAEWRVIAVLGRYPGLWASEVVERTAMDKVTVSRAVKRLADKGMLRRKSDPEDRRRRALHLTAGRGQRVHDEVVPKALAYEAHLLNTLANSEQLAFDKMLDKLLLTARTLNLRADGRRARRDR